MVRVRHSVRVRVPFRPITVRSAFPLRSVNYHIVKSGTRRSRSVPPFRSVPEIIPTLKPRLITAFGELRQICGRR